MKTENEKKYIIDYYSAIHWLHNNLILFNEAPEIFPDLWENCDMWGGWANDEESEQIPEIFQYYMTDCSQDDIKFLTKHFPNLLFLYSEKCDKFFLCVDHFGTAWDYVNTDFIPTPEMLNASRSWKEV